MQYVVSLCEFRCTTHLCSACIVCMTEVIKAVFNKYVLAQRESNKRGQRKELNTSTLL
jgi:hypothetical protein